MKIPRLQRTVVQRIDAAVRVSCVTLLLLLMAACGGGSSGSSGTPAPPPVAPWITTQPQSQTVNAPAPAVFQVAASGTAPLTYQWSKNGEAISGATAASYTTTSTTAADNAAQFTVVVSNSAGNVSSKTATLTVNLVPAALNAAAGGGQSATVATAFPTALQAAVADA